CHSRGVRARYDWRGLTTAAPAPAYPEHTCAAAISRSLNFCTLPLDVMGKASTITVYCGILKLASSPRQQAIRVSWVISAPGLGMMQAHGTSLRRGSGTP